MNDLEIQNLADAADMIINWYAFFKKDTQIKVIDLQHPTSICILSLKGDLIETNMSPVGISTVKSYYERDKKYLFDDDDFEEDNFNA